MMKRLHIIDVPIDILTREVAIEQCRKFLRDGKPLGDSPAGGEARHGRRGKQHHIVTINPELIVEAQKNLVFRDILQKSDLALADGIGVTLAARWFHKTRSERITGIDFMTDLCALAEWEQASVFFLGGRDGVAKRTAEVLQEKFPRLRIMGWGEDPLEISKYQNIDILFVALGAPKQELWIAKNLKHLSFVKIAMGVGGAFDLISGKRKRAPRMVRKLGFEWLWRLVQEPRRLGRMFRAAVIFPLLVIRRGREPSALSGLGS